MSVWIDGANDRILVNHHNFDKSYTLELQPNYCCIVIFAKFTLNPNINKSNYRCYIYSSRWKCRHWQVVEVAKKWWQGKQVTDLTYGPAPMLQGLKVLPCLQIAAHIQWPNSKFDTFFSQSFGNTSDMNRGCHYLVPEGTWHFHPALVIEKCMDLVYLWCTMRSIKSQWYCEIVEVLKCSLN